MRAWSWPALHPLLMALEADLVWEEESVLRSHDQKLNCQLKNVSVCGQEPAAHCLVLL